MKIAISGAGGFVGSHLRDTFTQKGWKVIPLSRELYANPQALKEALEGTDAVVNLAGAGIIARWTKSHKKAMYASRVDTTNALVDALALCERRPGIFVSASAIGIYAAGGPHTEAKHELDKGFLGRLAQDWEAAAMRADAQGARTVIFRLGVVLGPDGGVIQQMLPPFRAGLGGTIGDGSQLFSWVHIKDIQRAFTLAIENASMKGVYNLTSPEPSTNLGLTQAVASALKKPAVMRMPHMVARLRFGDGAKILTEGQSVLPERLLAEGFSFEFSKIEKAARDCIT